MGSITLDDTGTITPDGEGLTGDELETALEVYLDFWLAQHDIGLSDFPIFFPKRQGELPVGVEVVAPNQVLYGAYIVDRERKNYPDGKTRMQYSIAIRQGMEEM